MNWWYGDNAWMKVRARWSESAEWKELTELMASALGQTGDDQQKTWNKCFDMIAEQAVLYPVLQVKTADRFLARHRQRRGRHASTASRASAPPVCPSSIAPRLPSSIGVHTCSPRRPLWTRMRYESVGARVTCSTRAPHKVLL
ncbi:MAG: hypothetical protein ACLTSX_08350 [Collinsella sp.]